MAVSEYETTIQSRGFSILSVAETKWDNGFLYSSERHILFSSYTFPEYSFPHIPTHTDGEAGFPYVMTACRTPSSIRPKALLTTGFLPE